MNIARPKQHTHNTRTHTHTQHHADTLHSLPPPHWSEKARGEGARHRPPAPTAPPQPPSRLLAAYPGEVEELDGIGDGEESVAAGAGKEVNHQARPYAHLSRMRPKPNEPKLCITLKNDLRRAYLRERVGGRERERERGRERWKARV